MNRCYCKTTGILWFYALLVGCLFLYIVSHPVERAKTYSSIVSNLKDDECDSYCDTVTIFQNDRYPNGNSFVKMFEPLKFETMCYKVCRKDGAIWTTKLQ